jgi:hypothetical protein
MSDEEIRDALKKFYGKAPYNDPSNHCRGNGYFAVCLLEQTGAQSIEALCRRVGFER